MLLVKKIIQNTYVVFYQSIFEYGLLVWGYIKINNLKYVKQSQDSILRIILNKNSLVSSTITKL